MIDRSPSVTLPSNRPPTRREAEAEKALGPVLSELAECVARMAENEQEAARTVREHVQLLLAEEVVG